MDYREITPRGEARSFIDAYWTLEDSGAGSQEVQRVVPDGRAELILNLGQPFESFHEGQWRAQPQCFVSGQITGPLLLRPTGPTRIMGVRFQPQGANQVLGVPMAELTGQSVAIADLSRELAREIENACEAASFAQVEAALLRVCRQEDRLAGDAVRQMVDAGGDCSIGQVADSLGISARHLERRFVQAVGMTPKLFCRIQRFQRVFQVIEEPPSAIAPGSQRPNWVNAAIECGYYDQAHLIRDFMDFTGKTPTVLMAGGELARHFLADPPVSRFYNTAAGASR